MAAPAILEHRRTPEEEHLGKRVRLDTDSIRLLAPEPSHRHSFAAAAVVGVEQGILPDAEGPVDRATAVAVALVDTASPVEVPVDRARLPVVDPVDRALHPEDPADKETPGVVHQGRAHHPSCQDPTNPSPRLQNHWMGPVVPTRSLPEQVVVLLQMTKQE